MKALENIKSKISELENQKEVLQTEIAELSTAIEDSFEDLLLGRVDESTIDKAKDVYESKTKELQRVTELLERAKIARKKLAIEKIVPFARDNRQKKVAAIQAKYDKQIEAVRKARAAFLSELATLGKIKQEVGGVNQEFNDVLRDMGEQPHVYGAAISETVIIPNGWTREKDATGASEDTQKQVYASGNVPSWAAVE